MGERSVQVNISSIKISHRFLIVFLMSPMLKCMLSRHLAVGDSVTEDEVVCEIETDKVRKRMSRNIKSSVST